MSVKWSVNFARFTPTWTCWHLSSSFTNFNSSLYNEIQITIITSRFASFTFKILGFQALFERWDGANSLFRGSGRWTDVRGPHGPEIGPINWPWEQTPLAKANYFFFRSMWQGIKQEEVPPRRQMLVIVVDFQQNILPLTISQLIISLRINWRCLGVVVQP